MARKSPAQLDREIAETLATTSGAGLYDPKRLKAVSRATQHEKRKDIEARFPIGSYVKGTRFGFKDRLAKVTGYDLGSEEDAPRIKIRFIEPMGEFLPQAPKLEDHEIKAVSKKELAGDKLLARFKALDETRKQAGHELHEAAVEVDRVRDSEERVPYAQASTVVKSARRKAADRRLVKAVRAEKAVTTKMRGLVIKIRAIDPTRVPWGWQNTR